MFDTYVALGDSMSIDFYPSQDAEDSGVAKGVNLGSASLFYQNHEGIFPEFRGSDLVSRFGAIRYVNLALDGAIAEDVISTGNLNALSEFVDKRVLATLTLGGNDLLQVFRRTVGRAPSKLIDGFEQVLTNYSTVVRTLRKRLPKSTLILTTVFDPTDGTGTLPTNAPLYSEKLPIEFLYKFNDHVKATARANCALFADVHGHFCGHGAQCGSADNFWYWKPSPIEPSFRGASEIRRVWVETVKEVA